MMRLSQEARDDMLRFLRSRDSGLPVLKDLLEVLLPRGIIRFHRVRTEPMTDEIHVEWHERGNIREAKISFAKIKGNILDAIEDTIDQLMHKPWKSQKLHDLIEG